MKGNKETILRTRFSFFRKLPLPDGVEVVHAVSAVGHLSSSSIYPACLAPYVIVTACSDRTVRFWTTRLVTSEPMDPKHQFEWEEWRMESADGNSSIEVPGKVEKIQEDSLDLIPSPSPSVKIQIIGGKVYLR